MDVDFNSITGIPYNSYDFMNNIGTNPMILLLLVGIIIVYYFVFSSLGNTTSNLSANNGGIVFLEVLLWGVFIVLILLNGMSYFFNIDIVASIKNIFTETPEITITSLTEEGSSTVPEKLFKKEVFNIPGNYYNYDDSKALCKAYGGRLAKYEEIETAYENGADWCNYGWSDKQLALFPTNIKKWEKLQKIKGHEHDCGRPGINGGFINNPNVKFGVNCFGRKPLITPIGQNMMDNSQIYIKSNADIEFDKKVDSLKDLLPGISVSPFNATTW